MQGERSEAALPRGASPVWSPWRTRRRKGIGGTLFALLGMAGAGCGEGTDPPLGPASASGGADGGAGGAPGVRGGAPAISAGGAEALFDSSTLPSFALSLPPERWDSLVANARDEEYVEAELAYGGVDVGTVGLRFKGYATLNNCFEGGTLVCDKLSIKLKFDEYVADTRLFGLKRLVLNSMVYDDSLLHERLAYGLFRALGVAAPRAAWARVTVNGQEYGLYSMVEPVDGRFTEDRWPEDGDGNLYKEIWPALGGQSYFDGGLETNEEAAAHQAIAAFHAAIATATTPAERREVLDAYLDVASFQRFLAVEDAVAARDGVATFYTAADRAWTSNHNFFLYQATLSDRFTVVPWDQDVTFWLHNSTLVPHWSVTPADCSTLYTEGSDGGIRVAPGCDPVFQGIAAETSGYRAAVDELLSGPFSETAMTGRIDADVAFLADAVNDDPFRDVATWRDRVAEVRHNLPLLRARLEAFRDGVTIAPLALGRDAMNDFDAVQGIDALLGGATYTSAASHAELGIASGDGLPAPASDRGLRFGFEFRDDAEPWTHYAVFYLPFAAASRDLRGFAGVRFRGRSDQSRSLRVELVSDAHTPLSTYIYEGWDPPLTAEWQTLEVRFDAAALPPWATVADLAEQNALDAVLGAMLSLRFYPACVGRDGAGYLGAGAVDSGFVELDDLELFVEP